MNDARRARVAPWLIGFGVAMAASCGRVELDAGSSIAPLETIVIPLEHPDVSSVAGGDTTISNKDDFDDDNLGRETLLASFSRTGDPEEARALIRFDAQNVRDEVGTGLEVLTARLEVFELGLTPLSSVGSFAVHRSSVGWTELGATWNCPDDLNLANDVPDCGLTDWTDTPYIEPALSTAPAPGAGGGWVSFDVTADVAAMVASPDATHDGWVIRALPRVGEPVDDDVSAALFDSRESTDVAHRPRLVIYAADAEFAPVEPDPSPLDRSAPTTAFNAMRFLLDPERGLQVGVDAAAIDEERASVIRGYVYDRDTGLPLPGVRVSVLGHPEYGAAISRREAPPPTDPLAPTEPTGNFEILVNGGEPLTLVYERNTHLRAQRGIDAAWNDWLRVADVALVAETEVECSGLVSAGPTGTFVGGGPPRTDERGTRQLWFWLPAGTDAVGEGRDPLSTFSICNAEYTLAGRTTDATRSRPGETYSSAAEAMPAALPETSAYTFAAELRIEDMDGVPLSHPTFSNAADRIYIYLRADEFIPFPPGTVVPNGLYDEDRGAWSAEENGLAIGIGSTGLDCVDTGGRPSPLTADEVDALCVARVLPAGTYWRMPLTHFSPFDHNPPIWLPEAPNPRVAGRPRNTPCSNAVDGSIIYCESQTLGERMPIAGTGFSLAYSSERQAGRGEYFRTSLVPLAEGTEPDRVHVSLHIAGQVIPAPGSPFTAEEARELVTIEWDGADAYGRPLVGPRRGLVHVAYEYPPRYGLTAILEASSFGVPFPFDAVGEFGFTLANGNLVVPRNTPVTLGILDERLAGIGGWEIDAHHVYDPNESTLYMGDGTRRDVEGVSSIVRSEIHAEEFPAVPGLDALTIGPDGTLYYFDRDTHLIMRHEPGGVSTAVSSEEYDRVWGMSVGSFGRGSERRDVLYVADSSESSPGAAIYRVGLDDGIRRALLTDRVAMGQLDPTLPCYLAAPNPNPCIAVGSPMPASDFSIAGSGVQGPHALAAAPDGSLYFGLSHLLRYSEAGGVPTVELLTDNPAHYGVVQDIAVARDGTVLWSVFPLGVLARSVDGRVELVLERHGTSRALSRDEATLAASAETRVDVDGDIALDPTGALCFRDWFLPGALPGDFTNETRIRCVREGRLFTVSGTAGSAFGDTSVFPPELFRGADVEGTPATRTPDRGMQSFDIAPDGRIYFTEDRRPRLRVVEPAFTPDLDLATQHVIASPDGAALYTFDGNGRHLDTRDAITRTVLVHFEYDSLGRVESITDVEGEVTNIDRSVPGEVRFVAPGDVVTTLALDAAGYVHTYADPADSTWTFGYEGPKFAGLLRSLTDARGGEHAFTYDVTPGSGSGRLLTDTDARDALASPTPGATSLSPRVTDAEGWDVVTLTSPPDPDMSRPGRSTTYRSRGVGTPISERETTHGLATTHVSAPANGGRVTVTSWDGTREVTDSSPDPRPEIGMAGAYTSHSELRRPSCPDRLTSCATIIDSARSFDAGVLSDTVTIGTRTFRRDVEPVPGGFLYTMTPPSATPPSATPPSEAVDRIVRIRTDDRGRPTRLELPGQHPTCIEYPSATAVRPSLIRRSVLSGDDCSATGAERREVRFGYDPDGRRWLTSIREGVLGTGNRLVTTMVPDARGWASSITMPGAASTIEILYDEHGNITQFLPPTRLRRAHLFTYTGRDALATYTPAPTAEHSGEEIAISEYRPDGRLRRRIFRGGASVETTVDAYTGYLTGIRTVGDVIATSITIERDDGGRPLSLLSNIGNLSFTHDGPVTTEERWSFSTDGRGASGVLYRTVDPSLLLAAEIVSIGDPAREQTIVYGYDPDRLPTSASLDGSSPSGEGLVGAHLVLSFEDGPTAITRIGLADPSPTDIVTTTTASRLGELVASTTHSPPPTAFHPGGPPTDRVSDLLFETRICARDELGRIQRRTERWRVGVNTERRQFWYEYDAHGFLSRYREFNLDPGVDPCAGFDRRRVRVDRSYTYDDAGNRDGLDINADDQARVGGRRYDDLGHLIERDGRTFRYDLFGELRSTSLRTATVAYDYDPLQRLTAIRPASAASPVPLQRFIYRDALNPIAWQRRTRSPATGACAFDSTYFVYLSSTHTPDLMYVDSCTDGDIDQVARLITDERGSVRLVVDTTSGAILQQIEYDEWGSPSFRGAEDVQPFGFIGGIWDAETRLWRLGARDYDPSIGRWTTRDPIGFDGGVNLYGYCGSDPVNCIDVSGLISWFQALVVDYLSSSPVSWGWRGGTTTLGHLLGATSGSEPTWNPTNGGAWEYTDTGVIAPYTRGITIGRVICYRPAGTGAREHEVWHLPQTDVLGPFYLPAHAASMAVSAGISATIGPRTPTHGPLHDYNLLERGPMSSPPSAWP